MIVGALKREAQTSGNGVSEGRQGVPNAGASERR